jgi:uncharacterized protein YbdZ (MbtH family)
MRERSPLSEASPIFIATFFLILPVALLLIFVYKNRAAAEDYKDQDSEYARAVIEAMRLLRSDVSHSLFPVNLDQPPTFVTWTRQEKVAAYKNEKQIPKTTWVTAVPKLKSFCQDYVRSNGDDLRQLTLRLEQRLGLPPNSGYDTFVELKVDPTAIKDTFKFFRPCGDPSPMSNTCEPSFPPEPDEIRDSLKALDLGNSKDIEKYWLLSKYYWSFAAPEKYPRMKQYPWTSLGYTFDWAPKEAGNEDFVRWGESEFVISAGTSVQFVSAMDTAKYCAPQ